VTLRGGLGIVDFRLTGILFDPAAQAIGLPKIELRIRIALPGRLAPFGHRRGVIAVLPGGYARIHIGKGHARHCHQRTGNSEFHAQMAPVSLGHAVSHPWLTRNHT